MSRTKIPWCDFTINPVQGVCPVHCRDDRGKEYCYAAKPNGLYHRFKWNPEIRWEPQVFETQVDTLSKPSLIFVGSTHELFLPQYKSWMYETLSACAYRKEHTFLFLTKQYQNLPQWSPFPPNCWVGVSATDTRMALEGCLKLGEIEAVVKFLSIEPMLKCVNLPSQFLKDCGIGWIILGSQTQPVRHPRPEWVTDIIAAADAAKIPVFIKEPLASYIGIERFGNSAAISSREFPEVVK